MASVFYLVGMTKIISKIDANYDYSNVYSPFSQSYFNSIIKMVGV